LTCRLRWPVLTGILLFWVVGLVVGHPFAQLDSDVPISEGPSSCWLEGALSDLYEQVSPAVVSVVSYRLRTSVPSDDPNRPPRVSYQRLIASGIVLGEHGCVVTTARAAQPGDSITVHFPSGQRIPAIYKGMDAATHVAVLNLVEGAPFPFLSLPDRNTGALPDWVAAVAYGPWTGTTPGAPTLTLAEATSIDRIETHFDNRHGYLWRITAPIYPGNGGGALVNLNGDWIGLISGAVSGEQILPGQNRIPLDAGVIVPAERVAEAVMEIESGQREARGFMGVQTLRPTRPDEEGAEGIKVVEVLPQSPAARYGILVGDQLIRFNDHPLQRAGDLTAMLAEIPHGETVEIDLIRAGVPRSVTLVLGDQDALYLFVSAKRQRTETLALLRREIKLLESRARMFKDRLARLQPKAVASSTMADSSGGSSSPR